MEINEIIKLYQETGDTQYFSLLYKSTYRDLRNMVNSKFKLPKEEMEDLLSDLYVSVNKSIHQFDPNKSKFTTWCYFICMNKLYSKNRKNVREKSYERDVNTLLYSEREYHDIDVEKLLNIIRTAKCKEINRNIFIDYLKGKSLKEIGIQYNLRSNTVSMRIKAFRDKYLRSTSEYYKWKNI